MAKKKAVGRPAKKAGDKVKVVSAYLTGTEANRVNKKFGNITEAIRAEVLPKCG